MGETFGVPRSEGGGEINYILCNDRATLLWATNLGRHRKAHAARQGAGVEPADVDGLRPRSRRARGHPRLRRVALHLKGRFRALKLESFVKVSGSKGLHLSVPLNTEVTYEMTQPFAKTIAELAEQQLPKQVVSDMAKKLRRGKVLIDWSQNSDFKTTVCVYAMRAKEGGPFISMPVTWEELAKAVKRRNADALFFTPVAAVKRIKRLGDLFAPVLKLKQKLPTAFTKALASGPPPKLSSWPRNRNKSGQGARQKPARICGKTGSFEDAGAGGAPVKTADGRGSSSFRHPKTRGESSALRLAAGDAGRASLVGRAERSADETPGSPARHARRRPPARLRGF